jgi:hypothetical protein
VAETATSRRSVASGSGKRVPVLAVRKLCRVVCSLGESLARYVVTDFDPSCWVKISWITL